VSPFQHAGAEAQSGPHPLAGTAAEWVWLVAALPLLGFVANGLLALLAAYRPGPADPAREHNTTPSDGEAGQITSAPPHQHTPDGGAAGDDHAAAGRHRFATLASVIGPGVVAAAFGVAGAIFAALLSAGDAHAPFIQRYFSWMPVGDLSIDAAFQVDRLSVLMALVVTGVGALIHVFSVGYMRDDPGYPRYFAYLNLFVFFMLVLVLGANFAVLFVGWEGVGLCSYLLIGFWFSEKQNADAGKKAFIVNRIGDFGFLVAMLILFANMGTLDFTGATAAAAALQPGGALVTAVCLFLFLGCAGKSAQIPLYVWLPDAMAGPTPVSALIHAATMVTAGVYLVARSHFLFAIAPAASLTVVVVGALTAIFAATIALKQWDIKKVLAYSTVSQLGYMFVAVGAGAYVAGIFHLVTHAFFKALLFLGSGSAIYALHRAYDHTGSHQDAQDMRNMGGLRRALPATWLLMWMATLAIAGIPVFSGFFSKDEILGAVFARADESTLADTSWLGVPGIVLLYAAYALGLGAAFLTAVYMTRMMLYTFHGPNRTGEREREHLREAPLIMTAPLVVLGVLSVLGGWLNLPALLRILGPVGALEHWLEPVVGDSQLRVTHGVAPHLAHSVEYILVGAAVAVGIGGILLAVLRLRPARLVPKALAAEEVGFERVLANKYYVDEAYDAAFVRPTFRISRGLLWRGIDNGLIDGLAVNGSAYAARFVGWLGSQLQSGHLGTYAWALVIGVLAVLGAFTAG
jgi:NADH-quinone oxidoreductase subunit L